MTFGTILRAPLWLADKLNPLARAERWMLRNAPTFWRASVLKIIWYVLIAHFLMLGLGGVVAAGMTQIPTLTELMAFQIWVYMVSVVIVVGWISTLWQMPLIDRRPIARLSTIAVYTAFFFGLITLPNAYFVPVAGAVVKLYGNGDLATDEDALSHGIRAMCLNPTAPIPDLLATVDRLYVGRSEREPLKEMIQFATDPANGTCGVVSYANNYRFTPFRTQGPEHADEYLFELFSLYDWIGDDTNSLVEPPILRLWDDATRARFTDREASYYAAANANLLGRWRAVHAAMTVRRGPGMDSLFGVTAAAAAIWFSLFGAIVLFAAETLSSQATNLKDKLLARNARFGAGRLNRPFRWVDKRLLRRWPRIWVLRLHVALLNVLLILFISLFIEALIEGVFWFTADIFGPSSFGQYFDILFSCAIVTILMAISVMLLRMQTQYLRMDMATPGAARRAFLVIYVPIWLGFMMLAIFADELLPDSEFIAGLGAFLFFVVAAFSVGWVFRGFATMLRGTIAAFFIASAITALLILVSPSGEGFAAIMLIIVLMISVLLLRWPGFVVAKLPPRRLAVVALVMGAALPFLVAITLDEINLVYLNSSLDVDSVTWSWLMMHLVVAVMALPSVTQLQSQHIEPQKA